MSRETEQIRCTFNSWIIDYSLSYFKIRRTYLFKYIIDLRSVLLSLHIINIKLYLLFIFNRELSLEERQTVTNKTIAVYRDLETFLRSSEYNEDLRKELQKSNPDYPIVLSKRIKDLQKSDHGLVVSGKKFVIR